MLLAVGLAVGPRLYAAKVRAQERADGLEYTTGALLVSLTNASRAFNICADDLDMAIWTIQRMKRRRR